MEQESAGGILKFTLIDVDGAESLPVVYQGVVPDTLKVGNEVVVEGYLNSEVLSRSILWCRNALPGMCLPENKF